MIHRRVFAGIVALSFSLICFGSPVSTLTAELVAPGAKVEFAVKQLTIIATLARQVVYK